MAPLLPLGFIMIYQVDVAYGTLVYRTRGKTARRRRKYLRKIAKLAKQAKANFAACCTFRGGGEYNGVRT